jgi:hypothetical protein
MTRVTKNSSPAKAPPATTDAQRRAAVILEVLAGIRTTQEAAKVLKISTNHYYILERKALAGLVSACEPAPRRGRVPDVQRQQEKLQRELTRLEQQCQRQAALVRATQRALGVPVTAEPVDGPRGGKTSKRSRGAKTRTRRRQAPRALRAARLLQKTVAQSEPAAVQPKELDAATDVNRVLAQEASDDATRT